MTDRSIHNYYDQRYSAEGGETFYPDPSRYRTWFGTLLGRIPPKDTVLNYGCWLATCARYSQSLADANFDLIACLGVLKHVPEPGPLVAELSRVARPEASAVWVVPNHPHPLGGWAVEGVRRNPGPLDPYVAGWKRLAQGLLDRLPLRLTYQFVIETRVASCA